MNFRHLQKLSVLYNTLLRAKRFPSPGKLYNSAISEATETVTKSCAPKSCHRQSQSSGPSSSNKATSYSTYAPKLHSSVTKKRYSGTRSASKLTRGFRGSARNGRASRKKLEKSSAIRGETKRSNRVQCSSGFTPSRKSRARYTEEVKLKKILSTLIRSYKNYDSYSFPRRADSGLRLLNAACNAEFILRKDQIRTDFDRNTPNKKMTSFSSSSKKILNSKAIISIKEPRRYFSTKKTREVTSSRGARRFYSKKSKTEFPGPTPSPDKAKKRVYPPREKTRRRPGEKHPDEPLVASTVCPEPPSVDDPQGLPYYYQRVSVKGEDGESNKDEVQRVYFQYPNKIIENNTHYETSKDVMKTAKKSTDELEVEYIKEVVTKTVERISENEYQEALDKSKLQRAQEEYRKNLVHKQSNKNFQKLPKKNNVSVEYKRKICTKSTDNLIAENIGKDKNVLKTTTYSETEIFNEDSPILAAPSKNDKTSFYEDTINYDLNYCERMSKELENKFDLEKTIYSIELDKMLAAADERTFHYFKARDTSDLLLAADPEEKQAWELSLNEIGMTLFKHKTKQATRRKVDAAETPAERQKSDLILEEQEAWENSLDQIGMTYHKNNLVEAKENTQAEMKVELPKKPDEEEEESEEADFNLAAEYEQQARNMYFKNTGMKHKNKSPEPYEDLEAKKNIVLAKEEVEEELSLNPKEPALVWDVYSKNCKLEQKDDLEDRNKVTTVRATQQTVEKPKIIKQPWEMSLYEFGRKLISKETSAEEHLEKKKKDAYVPDFQEYKPQKKPHVENNNKFQEIHHLKPYIKTPEKKVEKIVNSVKNKMKYTASEHNLKKFEGSLYQKQYQEQFNKTYPENQSNPTGAEIRSQHLENRTSFNKEYATDAIYPILSKRPSTPIGIRKNNVYVAKDVSEVAKLSKTKSSHIVMDPEYERLPFEEFSEDQPQSNHGNKRLPYADLKAYELPLKVSNEKQKKAEETSTKLLSTDKKKVIIFPQMKDKEDDLDASDSKPIGILNIILPSLKVPYVFERKADVLKNELSSIMDHDTSKNSKKNEAASLDLPTDLESRVQIKEENGMSEVEKICKEELKSLQARNVLNEELIEDKKELSHEDRQKANFSKFVEVPQKDNACLSKNLEAAKNEEKTDADTTKPRKILNVIDKIWHQVEQEAIKTIKGMERNTSNQEASPNQIHLETQADKLNKEMKKNIRNQEANKSAEEGQNQTEIPPKKQFFLDSTEQLKSISDLKSKAAKQLKEHHAYTSQNFLEMKKDEMEKQGHKLRQSQVLTDITNKKPSSQSLSVSPSEQLNELQLYVKQNILEMKKSDLIEERVCESVTKSEALTNIITQKRKKSSPTLRLVIEPSKGFVRRIQSTPKLEAADASKKWLTDKVPCSPKMEAKDKKEDCGKEPECGKQPECGKESENKCTSKKRDDPFGRRKPDLYKKKRKQLCPKTTPCDLRFNMKATECSDCAPQCPDKNPCKKEKPKCVKDMCDMINYEAKLKPPGSCPPPTICKSPRRRSTSSCQKKDPFKKTDPCKTKTICSASKDDQITRKKSTSSCDSEDPCKKKKDPCKKKSTSSCCKTKKKDPCKKKSTSCDCDKKKKDPCEKKSTPSCGPPKKKDPCKKKSTSSCGSKKSSNPCGEKKKDPCKKKSTSSCGPSKKTNPCKKKSTSSCVSKKSASPCGSKKKDPCKKKSTSSCSPPKKKDPCKKKSTSSCCAPKKKDPCKKKSTSSCSPRKKKDPCQKEDPCKKKKSSACKLKKMPMKFVDPCKKDKKQDPCKKVKKHDPGKKKKPLRKDAFNYVCRKNAEEELNKDEFKYCCQKKEATSKAAKPPPKKKKFDPCKGSGLPKKTAVKKGVKHCKGNRLGPKKQRRSSCEKKSDPCKKKKKTFKCPPKSKNKNPCKSKKSTVQCKGPNTKNKIKDKEDPCARIKKVKKDPCEKKSKPKFVCKRKPLPPKKTKTVKCGKKSGKSKSKLVSPSCKLPGPSKPTSMCDTKKSKSDPCISSSKKKKKDDPCKPVDPCKGISGSSSSKSKKKPSKSRMPVPTCDKKPKDDPCKPKDDPCKPVDPCKGITGSSGSKSKKKPSKSKMPVPNCDKKPKDDPCKPVDPCKQLSASSGNSKCKKPPSMNKLPQPTCKKSSSGTKKSKSDPCVSVYKKKQKKQEKPKDDPCKPKEDPCKPKEDPCKPADPCKQAPASSGKSKCKKPPSMNKLPQPTCKKPSSGAKKSKSDPCVSKDPCKPKADPCKPKTDPCKPKADPCKPKTDPCKPKTDPCKPKSDPCKPKLPPPSPCKKEKPKDDPCKPKKDPCKPKTDPCKPKEDPCKPKEDPCKPKKDPCKPVDPCKLSSCSKIEKNCSDPPKKWLTTKVPDKIDCTPKEKTKVKKSKLPFPFCSKGNKNKCGGANKKPVGLTPGASPTCSEIKIDTPIQPPKECSKKGDKSTKKSKCSLPPPTCASAISKSKKKSKKRGSSLPPPTCSTEKGKGKAKAVKKAASTTCYPSMKMVTKPKDPYPTASIKTMTEDPAAKFQKLKIKKCRSDPNVYGRDDVLRKKTPFEPPKIYKVQQYKLTLVGPKKPKDTFDTVCRRKPKTMKIPPPSTDVVCNDSKKCLDSKKQKVEDKYLDHIEEMIQVKKCISEHNMRRIPKVRERKEEGFPKYLQILKRLQNKCTEEPATPLNKKNKRSKQGTSSCCNPKIRSKCDRKR